MSETPSSQLNKILEEDEELLWSSKPSELPFMLTRAIGGIVLGILFIYPIFVGLGLLMAGPLGVFLGFLLASVPVIIICLAMAYVPYQKAEYAVTGERVIQFGGFIGRDYSSIRWDKIQDIETSVGLWDKIFSTGSVVMRVAGMAPAASSVGGQGITFLYLKEPYELTKKFQNIERNYGE